MPLFINQAFPGASRLYASAIELLTRYAACAGFFLSFFLFFAENIRKIKQVHDACLHKDGVRHTLLVRSVDAC